MAQRGGYSLQELVDAASAAERLPASERVVGGYLAQGLLPPPRAAGAHTLFEDEHLIRLRLLLRLTAQYVPLPEAGRWLSALDHAQVLAVLPHGTGTVTCVEGGLEIFNDAGTGSTVLAHAAAIVRLDIV